MRKTVYYVEPKSPLILAAAALYGGAVLGLAPLRPLLIPLFGLPLLVHLCQDIFADLAVYTASERLRECSVLAIMAGLLCVSLGMRRQMPVR